MLKPVTKRFTDNSTLTRFEFTFYCDCCSKALPSVVIKPQFEFRKKLFLSRDEREARAIIYANDHSKAYERANNEARHELNRCEKCGELLPRPSVIDRKTGVRRCIKGFESAYRRMEWDVPSPTLTQNLQFEASDKKIHPTQNRVLSIYEALVLQTIADYSYDFSINGKEIPRTLYCEIIGESVPPRLIELVCKNILKISSNA